MNLRAACPNNGSSSPWSPAMPDPTPPASPSAPMPGYAELAAMDDAYGFALGCECADPALQIERWRQETAAPQGEPH
jgi:hypothetical protein